MNVTLPANDVQRLSLSVPIASTLLIVGAGLTIAVDNERWNLAAAATVLVAAVAYVPFFLRDSCLGTLQLFSKTSVYGDRLEAIRHRLQNDDPTAVAALAELANRWPTGRQWCIDTLCACIRRRDGVGEASKAGLRLLAERLRVTDSTSWSSYDLNLAGATITGTTFIGARFAGGSVDLRDAIFDGHAGFANAHFDAGKVDFTRTVFDDGLVDFTGATFGGATVDFTDATFGGATVEFSLASVDGGTIDFARSHLARGKLIFSGTRFTGGRLTFDGARISGSYLLFVGALIAGGDIDFRRAEILGGSVEFTGSLLTHGAVDLTAAVITGGIVDLSGVVPNSWPAAFSADDRTAGRVRPHRTNSRKQPGRHLS